MNVKIVKRTFEAKKYPKGSKKRRKLNKSWRTSEYFPEITYQTSFKILSHLGGTDIDVHLNETHGHTSKKSALRLAEMLDTHILFESVRVLLNAFGEADSIFTMECRAALEKGYERDTEKIRAKNNAKNNK